MKIPHPNNPNNIIEGEQLKAGDYLQAGDVFASSNGQWVSYDIGRAQLLHTLPGTTGAVWVRPSVSKK